jgi:hypothetical protein
MWTIRTTWSWRGRDGVDGQLSRRVKERPVDAVD